MQFRQHLTPDDWPNVDNLLRTTYPTEFEAGLVERLRNRGQMAAEHSIWHHGALIAYVCYSPVSIENVATDRTLWGIGPMAVDSEYQHEGLAQKLMTESFEETHADALVVHGHAGFFGHLGFRPAADFGLTYSADGSQERQFLALECWAGALDGLHGHVLFDRGFYES